MWISVVVTHRRFCYSTFKVLNTCRLRGQSTRGVKTNINRQTFRVANFPSELAQQFLYSYFISNNLAPGSTCSNLCKSAVICECSPLSLLVCNRLRIVAWHLVISWSIWINKLETDGVNFRIPTPPEGPGSIRFDTKFLKASLSL